MQRVLWACVFLFFLTAAAPAQRIEKNWVPDDEAPQTNLVLIFADDMGWGDLACYGHPTIRTPRLDQMAAEGTRFTQFYSASPACTASRYALLTGRLPVRSGFSWVLGPKSPRGMHPNEITLAEVMKSGGYATAIFGKWHLGRPNEYLPLAHGFDEYLGFPYSNDMQPPKWMDIPLLEGNDILELNPDQRKLTRLYTDRAIDFIERNQKKPFFVYLPYAMPHLPLHPGEDFAGESTRGPYGDVVEEIDHHVGRIMDRLRELELAENTLVIFTSDNGPWIIKGEEGGSSGLLRDGKGSTWEGGVRVPAIFWQPGRIAAGHIERSVASTMDIVPTAIEMTNMLIPSETGLHRMTDHRTIDGEDLTPLLEGKPRNRGPLFFYGPSALHAVRVGDWKLHVKTSSQTGIKHFDGKLPLLFNLERDPSEQYDLAEQDPERVEIMLGLIRAHQADVAATSNDFALAEKALKAAEPERKPSDGQGQNDF
jgi:arylsulfatase